METQDWEEAFWNPNWSPLGFQVNHQIMVMKSLVGGGFLSPFSERSSPPSNLQPHWNMLNVHLLLSCFASLSLAWPSLTHPWTPCISFAPGEFHLQNSWELLFCNRFFQGDPFFFKRLMGVEFGWWDTFSESDDLKLGVYLEEETPVFRKSVSGFFAWVSWGGVFKTSNEKTVKLNN